MLKESQQREYLIKQKELIEKILLDLENIKVTPLNISSVVNTIKKVILVIGSGVVSYILKLHEISRNDDDFLKMIESLQRQIVSLNERIKKIEGK